MNRPSADGAFLALGRRTLLQLAGAWGFCLAAPLPAVAYAPRAADPARLVRHLGTPQYAGRLCKRVRAQHEMDRIVAILDRLVQRLLLAEDQSQTAPAALRRAVRLWIASDFEHDRVLPVDGWILSETEVGLAVLTAEAQTRSGWHA